MASDELYKKGEKLAARFLRFPISENPSWHRKEVGKSSLKPVDLIADIIGFRRKHSHEPVPESVSRQFRDDFILQMSHDEEVGVQNETDLKCVTEEEELERRPFAELNRDRKKSVPTEDDDKRLETKNMLKTWKYFEKLKQKDEGSLLSRGIVEKGHSILMKDLVRKPGHLSESARATKCPVINTTVIYPCPKFVDSVFDTLLDYANFIGCYLREKHRTCGESEETVTEMIKYFAWFFFCFVQLHPFGDGNGRMSRILYFYLQSLLSPFPVGVYNIHAPTSKIDYYKAICQAREDNRRELEGHQNEFQQNNWQYESTPSELAAMILECQWYAWKKFIEECQKPSCYERNLTLEYITPDSLENYNANSNSVN